MTNTELPITTDSVNTLEHREKKINKLERRLNSLSKTISKLEEKDMSLDEMEHCDLYNVESNLKKRAYEVS
jgi:predicted RNase H-like nuclease (RuvC/YqgF family)